MQTFTQPDCTYLKTKHGKTRYVLDGPSSDQVDHAIVFVCGISSHSYAYLHLMNAMEQTWTNSSSSARLYLRYDKYGRGKSSNPDIEHTADLFVDQLYELIDNLIIKAINREKRPRITVVGFSMGGCVSVHFAAKHSDIVDDLILFSPAGATWKLPFGSSLVKVPWLGNVVYGALHMASTDEQKVATGLFDLNDSLVQDRMKHAVEWKTKEDENNSQVTSFVNSFTNFPLQGSDEQIGIVGKSNIRVLLIWSIFDLTVPSTECFPTYYNLLKANNKSRFVILNNTRHMFFMEREQDTAHLIVNFLKDSSDDGSVFDKFNRTITNVKKQEPNRQIMTKADTTMWNFFDEHGEFKKFII